MIRLSDEERRKFSGWLRQEATSEDAMATQFEKLRDPVGTRHYRMKAAAKTLIANEIDTTETVTITNRE